MGSLIRISWYSNAPWAGTGYGTQTAQVTKRLAADGHKVAILANHGLHGGPWVWNGIDVLPAGYDLYSNDVLAQGHDLWLASGDKPEPGWLITLFDVHALDPKPLEGANVASWTPVDHSPVPPKVAEWARAHRTIAMSRFGQAMLADQKIQSDYIPHAIESVFRPTPSDTRKRFGLPDDAFLVMINAANKGNVPPRKAWAEMFNAYAAFAAKHPNAYLYCHTHVRGIGGIDLLLLALMCGIPNERLRWPDQFAYTMGGIDQKTLAELYTASDVLLATSMGEGFGIPVVESMACGTPAIVTNFSAQPELVGDAGWLVAAQPYHDFGQASWLAMPLVGDIVRKLDDAYDSKGSMREKAITKAMEYDADLVYDAHWKPLLADLQANLTLPRSVRRAARRKRR